jgi:glycosyltransferase involved in cell wall biosynthesis
VSARGLRIVAFAYACEPDKGSEPGAGWTWVQMLAELGEVWVVTRANNRGTIEEAWRTLRVRDRLHFVYVDLPSWVRFWKRGQRGVRAYYLLWQLAALVRARRMHRREPFQLAWHLTMANAWLGSAAALVGPPFIYGPVGGGVAMPWRLVRAVGARAAIYEVIRACARFAGRYVNPFARLAWRRARLILVQNPETAKWLPRRYRRKSVVFPHAIVTTPAATPPRRRSGHTALFAGRLLGWKGVAVALRAVAQSPDWRFIICGSGPDEGRLRRIALRLELNGRVEFRGWRPRAELLKMMSDEADALLFPSLHDDSPLAVTDALATGLPVICLDRGGPTVLADRAGTAVPATGGLTALSNRVADALQRSVFTPSAVSFERARDLSVGPQLERLTRVLTESEGGAPKSSIEAQR